MCVCVRVCVQCAWTDVSAVAYTISALCIHYSAPIGERSIVMTVHVYVCLSVRDHIFGTTCPIFTDFLCVFPMAVDRFSSGDVMIRYVLLVLWITSHLLTSQGCSTSPPS